MRMRPAGGREGGSSLEHICNRIIDPPLSDRDVLIDVLTRLFGSHHSPNSHLLSIQADEAEAIPWGLGLAMRLGERARCRTEQRSVAGCAPG